MTSKPLSIVGHFLGALTEVSPQGLQGNLQDSTTGNLIVIEKWGGASNNQHADLSRLPWYLQSPSSSPNEQLCASAEPSWWHSVTRELSGVQACLS